MQNKIKCPHCGEDINVSDLLRHEIEIEFNQKLTQEKAILQKQNEQKQKVLDETLAVIKQKEINLENEINQRIKIQKDELKRQLEIDNLEFINALKQEILQKSKQISELNLKNLEIEQLKLENTQIQERIKKEYEIEINKKLIAQKNEIQKSILEQNELILKEKDEQLNRLKLQISNMKTQMEQGSVQSWGEAQELAIEQWLESNFPLDSIQEIKKGEKGADCIQIVNTRDMVKCGSIYYESKRTKEFSNNWIDKLKSDMRERSVDIGVLVTAVMPKGMERMGLYEGIWICSYDEFKSLSAILRENIISLARLKSNNTNKAEKMNMLYSYLTSNEFKMNVEAIVDGFSSMQNDLNKEKNAMQRIWKAREKQIEKVRESAISMYASLQGIAGSKFIQNIQMLELDNIVGNTGDEIYE